MLFSLSKSKKSYVASNNTSSKPDNKSPNSNRPTKLGRYVTCDDIFYSGYLGLGNQMFKLAAVIYVAELTGRQPVLQARNWTRSIDQVKYLPWPFIIADDL